MKKTTISITVLILLVVAVSLVESNSSNIKIINQDGREIAEANLVGNDLVITSTTENYQIDEITIKKMKEIPDTIHLGEFKQTLQAGYIIENPITIESNTHLLGILNELTFDEATIKLKKDFKTRTVWTYNENLTKIEVEEIFSPEIASILKCEDWSSNWECNSNFIKTDISSTQTDEYIIFTVNSFSGWLGNSYFYADLEGTDTNLCNGGEEYSDGVCSGANAITGEENNTVYMDFESGKITDQNGDERVFVYATYDTDKSLLNDRVYFYLDDNFSVDPSDNYRIFGLFDYPDQDPQVQVYLNSSLYLGCAHQQGNASTLATCSGQTMQNIDKEKWYYVETYYNYTEGNLTCYLNGEVFCSETGLSFDDNIKGTIVGQFNTNIDGQGVWYWDEHRSSDQYIGGYPVIENFTNSLDADNKTYENVYAQFNASVFDYDGDFDSAWFSIKETTGGFWDIYDKLISWGRLPKQLVSGAI